MKNTKKSTRYDAAPRDIAEGINSSEIIEDFLPRPDELVFKKEIFFNSSSEINAAEGNFPGCFSKNACVRKTC